MVVRERLGLSRTRREALFLCDQALRQEYYASLATEMRHSSPSELLNDWPRWPASSSVGTPQTFAPVSRLYFEPVLDGCTDNTAHRNDFPGQ